MCPQSRTQARARALWRKPTPSPGAINPRSRTSLSMEIGGAGERDRGAPPADRDTRTSRRPCVVDQKHINDATYTDNAFNPENNDVGVRLALFRPLSQPGPRDRSRGSPLTGRHVTVWANIEIGLDKLRERAGRLDLYIVRGSSTTCGARYSLVARQRGPNVA